MATSGRWVSREGVCARAAVLVRRPNARIYDFEQVALKRVVRSKLTIGDPQKARFEK